MFKVPGCLKDNARCLKILLHRKLSSRDLEERSGSFTGTPMLAHAKKGSFRRLTIELRLTSRPIHTGRGQYNDLEAFYDRLYIEGRVSF
jgi:hypothetical protein